MIRRLWRKPIASVRKVNLDVASDEVIAIVGVSGSGKTTLLKAICGAFKEFECAKTRGQILIDDKKMSQSALKRSGMIRGAFHSMWKPNSNILDDIGALAKSGGSGTDLVKPPKLVIMDEPTRNLEANDIRLVGDYIEKIQRQSAVMIAAHDIPFVLQHCQRVIHLQGGAYCI